MLARQMAGYAPSLIVTAIASLAGLSFLTHFLSHAQYGHYALAVNMMTMLLGVCFLWLQNATSRLMPQAVIDGSEARLSATLYGMFGLSSLVALILFGLIAAVAPLGDWRVAVIFAPMLAVLRALLNINQAFHRNFIRIARYNIIEIGQAVIGLGVTVTLILFVHPGADEAVTGSVIGLAAMAVFDWRMLSRVMWKNFDAAKCREILHFGLPFVANFAFSFILAGSDRFLIEYFLGPDQVGLYAAGYAFPDRIGQYLFMAVATASFPLIVRRLEQEGVEAARDQTYINGIAMLALALPACVGMVLADRQIAAVFIGEDFRASAVAIMPWIAVATILNGFAAHYYDHAFLLAKKTQFFFFTLGPAALLNLFANLYVIPRCGIIGAAYTTVAAYAVYLTLSVILGRGVFRVRFPFKPALQIGASVAIMALALSVFTFPETIIGLAAMVACGCAVYGLGIFGFDVMGVRSYIATKRHGVDNPPTNESGLRFDILSSPDEIASEWAALHRAAGALFGSYEWFDLWRRHVGQGAYVHIATARDGAGKLVALLPLAVRRGGFLRIAEWAGHEVFDYGDALAINANAARDLWNFTLAQKFYDIALIKDIGEGAVSLPVLTAHMRLRQRRRNYFLTLDFASGEAWLAAQSRKLRGDTRRKRDKLQAQGAVAFHIYKNADIFPDAVMDALYAQKSAWFRERGARGIFTRPQMREFLRDLAHDAARRGMLYLAWLTCGDKIIACHMGFVWQNTLHLYHTTYDAAFAACSPGNIMMVETIQAAIDCGWRELDFMRGDETYKQRFANGSRTLSAFAAARGWRGEISLWLRDHVGGKKSAGAEKESEDD